MSRSSGRLLAFAVALPALAVLLCACAREDGAGRALLMSCDFENGTADGWEPKEPGHWRVAEVGGTKAYELTAPGEQGAVRAPTSWSLWTGREVSSFELSGRLRCHTDPAVAFRDMCVFFHFQDPTHFYYVHFAGTSDGVHNIIGLVNGSDRVKISSEPAGASVFRLTDREWHAFKVVRDAATVEIRAYLDDMATPILTARDLSLPRGLVGIGSFDDTGAFDDLRLVTPWR